MFTRLSLIPIWLCTLAAASVFAQATPSGLSKATFAMGCFWCAEEAMDKLPGIISTTSGYIGGSKKNPTYHEVSAGSTGHTEAVQVMYDPKNRITSYNVCYTKLLRIIRHPLFGHLNFCQNSLNLILSKEFT